MEPDHVTAWDVTGFIEGELEPPGWIGCGSTSTRARSVCTGWRWCLGAGRSGHAVGWTIQALGGIDDSVL